jgi:GNAT superfamily N-acetyltransferase
MDDDINRAVGERWRRLDSLLPEPGPVAPGCGETFWTRAGDGFAVCRHLTVPASSVDQAWAAATEYVLTPRLAGPDVGAGLDALLAQWREHLSGLPEAHTEDTAARVRWPSRDTTGVRALQRHGLAPVTVIAARPAKRVAGPQAGPEPAQAGQEPAQAGPEPAQATVIRLAGPADLAVAVRFQMDVIRYDEQFGVSRVRPATEALIREDLITVLNRRPSWVWLAEDGQTGEPAGLLILQPPEQAGWIAPLVSAAPAAYLATMFVQPGERGSGTGAALVSQAHAAADDGGAAMTLLHYAMANPLSGPFWSRMGYRPLWTLWGADPAAVVR